MCAAIELPASAAGLSAVSPAAWKRDKRYAWVWQALYVRLTHTTGRPLPDIGLLSDWAASQMPTKLNGLGRVSPSNRPSAGPVMYGLVFNLHDPPALHSQWQADALCRE